MSRASAFVAVWGNHKVGGTGNLLVVLNYRKRLIIPKPNGEVEITYKEIGWGLPGGGVEEGESAFEAAYRELGEETPFMVKIQMEPILVDRRWDHDDFVFIGFHPMMVKPNWTPMDDPEEGIFDWAWLPIEPYSKEEWKEVRVKGGPYPFYNAHINRIMRIFDRCAECTEPSS